MGKLNHALISVSDKTGVVEFARGLVELGATILSTGGTANAIRTAGVPVTEVSSHTGSPEILGGRVKTLHPKIHGGLLGRRGRAEDVRQMQEQGIEPIDVVVVNLYPFESTIARPDCTFEDAIENIDIGGPSMLRSLPRIMGRRRGRRSGDLWIAAGGIAVRDGFSSLCRELAEKCFCTPHV